MILQSSAISFYQVFEERSFHSATEYKFPDLRVGDKGQAVVTEEVRWGFQDNYPCCWRLYVWFKSVEFMTFQKWQSKAGHLKETCAVEVAPRRNW